eukprot:TRINITY_DN10729_c0_g3_i1.p1 TRINITY_DN10729_c0_g3~~TRINITY_DN10729_c0_g3_i1.p1  ORF type:complete len:580 (+),score=202.18 TRINITY_DN10729_c0_g3_i1:49-1740(+)
MDTLATAECGLTLALYAASLAAAPDAPAGWGTPPPGTRPLLAVLLATWAAQAAPGRDRDARRGAGSGWLASGAVLPLLVYGLPAEDVGWRAKEAGFRVAWLSAVLVALFHLAHCGARRVAVRAAAVAAAGGLVIFLHRYRADRQLYLLSCLCVGVYVACMRCLAGSFTEGEALLMSQLASLLLYAVYHYATGGFEPSQLRTVMVVGVFGALCIGTAVLGMHAAERWWRGAPPAPHEEDAEHAQDQRDGGGPQLRRRGRGADGPIQEKKDRAPAWLMAGEAKRTAVYAAATAAGAAGTFGAMAHLLNENPFVWLANYTLAKRGLALRFVVYYCVVLAVGLPLSPTRFSAGARTVARKYFHLLALLMFIPTLMLKVRFLALAFSVAFAVFVVVESLRIAQVAPLARAVTSVMATYTDEKDLGTAVLTHIYLLLGCSSPVWYIFIAHHGGIFSAKSLLTAMAGVAVTGLGDACASVVGTRYGGVKWPWRIAGRPCRKSIAGSCAMFASMAALQYFALYAYGFQALSQASWVKLLCANVFVTLMEAATDQVDNLLLPLMHIVTLQLI